MSGRIGKRPRRGRAGMKRRIWLWAAIVAAAAVTIALAAGVSRENSKMTGEEWFFAQGEYISQFASLADETDDVTTLYIMGSISEDDFLVHLSVLEGELALMEASYETDKEAADIKNGSHTYYTKKGCESVPACFEAFKGLYSVMEANSSDPEALSYAYLAYHQEMTDAVADYNTVMAMYISEGLESGAVTVQQPEGSTGDAGGGTGAGDLETYGSGEE